MVQPIPRRFSRHTSIQEKCYKLCDHCWCFMEIIYYIQTTRSPSILNVFFNNFRCKMKLRFLLLRCCIPLLIFLLDSGRKPQVVQTIISKEILRILRNSKGKREPESPQGNGAKCFPGAAAPESKRLPVGPLQKKLPGASSHFFEL